MYFVSPDANLSECTLSKQDSHHAYPGLLDVIMMTPAEFLCGLLQKQVIFGSLLFCLLVLGPILSRRPFPAFLIPVGPRFVGFLRSWNILVSNRIILHLVLASHLGFKSRPNDDL